MTPLPGASISLDDLGETMLSHFPDKSSNTFSFMPKQIKMDGRMQAKLA
jgi:hypothetical protein